MNSLPMFFLDIFVQSIRIALFLLFFLQLFESSHSWPSKNYLKILWAEFVDRLNNLSLDGTWPLAD